MLSGRLERLFRSASARLAALYAALLFVAFLIAGALVWLATSSTEENEIRQRVVLEMEAIQHEWRAEGSARALAEIRLRDDQPGALEYCIWDEDDRVEDCSLDIAMPVLGWNRMKLANPTSPWEAHELLLLAQQTPSGGVLAVADSLQDVERSGAALVNTILWVGGLALALALAAGFIAARGTLRRMDGLSQTLALAGAGDLSVRAPERAGGDDIDAIARGLNQMLARIDGLLGNIRRVSTDI
ncbi:MAG: HAMP domain-containing protein, partial [Terricaulis sp.]